MTNALTIPDKDWFAIKESASTVPVPFERTIALGVYDVEGLVHMDNPAVHLKRLRRGSRLDLRCATGVCEVVKGDVVFGRIPSREGEVFNRLLRGGKKLAAKVVVRSLSGLEPELSVEIIMEEI